MLVKVTMHEPPTVDLPDNRLHTSAAADNADFRAEMRFMFAIPAALLLFLGLCAAIMIASP